MTRPALSVLVLLVAAGSARSQPTARPAVDALAALPDDGPAGPRRTFLLRPSSTGALLATTAATAVGVGLAHGVYSLDGQRGGVENLGFIAFALVPVVAPSAGNLWLGKTSDALVGLGLRAVGAGAAAYGLRNFDFVTGSSTALDDYIAAGGVLVFLGGVGYDIATQYRNGRRARVETSRVRIVPTGVGLSLHVGL